MVITSSGGVILQPRRNLWQRLTCWQRFLVFYVPISLVLVWTFGLILILADNNATCPEAKLNVAQSQSHCLTAGCVQAASRLLKSMNQSVQPCDNFYQFACGGYIKNAFISNNRQKSTILTQISDLVQLQLKEIFEEPLGLNELRSFSLLKQMYQNCMNVAADSIEFDLVKTMLEDIAGGWPVLKGNAWLESKFDWQKSTYKFRKYGLSTNNFMTFDVIEHPKDASRKILSVDAATLEPSPENLLKGTESEDIKAYHDYLIDLVTLFGAKENISEGDVKDVINFEINLARINTNRNWKSNYYTIQELQSQYPKINWLELINYAIFLSDKALQGENLISVIDLAYVKNLETLLEKTSKRVQANHVIFQAVTSLLPFLSERFNNVRKTLKNGIVDELPRWKRCTDMTSKTLKIAAGSIYVRKYFKTETTIKATQVVNSIRDEYVKSAAKLLNKQALEKLKTMTLEVGYPTEILQDEEIESYYFDLKIVTDNYLLFMGNLSLFKTDKKFRKLFDVPGGSSWQDGVNPINVGVTYSLHKNALEIPAAVLQEGFFEGDQLQCINYGGIGFYVSLVLAQALIDAEGMKGQKCFSDRFSTESHDIAAFTGLEMAYLAYQEWVEQNRVELQLFGLNYTTRQLFWISVANTRCEKAKESVGKLPISLISNYSNRFAEDFNCKKPFNLSSINKNCIII